MKKALATILALVMALGLCTSAWATSEGPGESTGATAGAEPGGTGAHGRQTKTYGVTLTLTTIQTTRKNYLFLGWSKDRNATLASYFAGGSYTDNADVTLYAVWRYDPETYTIRYDANGGTGAPASQTKTYGVPLTLSEVKPMRAGYEFLGWATSRNATVS